jgi:hypothetical protein
MDYNFFMEPADNSGPMFLGVGTLEKGRAIVDALETLWQGFVTEDWLVEFNTETNNLMAKYEGCNIVAVALDNSVKYLYTDIWEIV